MIPSAGRAALGVLAALILAAAAAASPDTAGGISGAPLAPRAHPRGRTMFTQLSPDETGLRTENKYDDPKMWSSLYQEFEGGSIGTGVAIGDYDGDGRPDIFVVTKTHGCRLSATWAATDSRTSRRRRASGPSPGSGTSAPRSSTSTTAGAWTSTYAASTRRTSSI